MAALAMAALSASEVFLTSDWKQVLTGYEVAIDTQAGPGPTDHAEKCSPVQRLDCRYGT